MVTSQRNVKHPPYHPGDQAERKPKKSSDFGDTFDVRTHKIYIYYLLKIYLPTSKRIKHLTPQYNKIINITLE